jgi:tetratricopeptide (TPR) repeat protein/tRNA A-37 threonylcarbamoyl transferase component Bud32
MPDVLDLLSAALEGRYKVESEVGRGGMATVFLAMDLKHDRRVAIKVLHPEIAASVGHERFLREIQIAARLEHPAILTLIDSGEADGLPFFVMPYLEGESLRERIDREGELPIDEALQIAAEVADGLDYAHEQGVVHRDIKPSNLLLYRGHALIADFGVARALDLAGSGATVTGLAVGTPKYMSPEQATGRADIDGRSDIYGLACVLWEMLAGEAPYDGPTPHAIMARKVTEDTPSLRVRRRTVSRELENVLAKAMARSPADRFPSAAAFAKALKARGAGVRRPPRVSAVRRKRLGIGAAAVAILAMAGFAYWQSRSPADDSTTIAEAGIAFLPFAEQGEFEGPLEGDSVARAMSLMFGTTDRYEPRPHLEVRDAVNRLCPGGINEICSFSVARELGTAMVVTGRVTAARGDSIQVLAEMVDMTGERAIPAVAVAGSRDDPDRILFDLLRELWLAPIAESEQGALLANLTTSPDAFAASLDGEIHFDDWDLVPARRAFERAVAADSTLAMAWYRLAVIWDWNNNPPRLKPAIDKAIEYADRLPQREQRAVLAFNDLVWGASEKAESVFEELLEEDPEDPFVNYQAGLLSFGYAWKSARPMTQAIESFRKVLAVQPENSSAMIYLMWALAEAGDYEAMEELDAQFPENTAFTDVIRMIRGHRLGDTAVVHAGLEAWNARPPDRRVELGLYILGTSLGAVPDLELVSNALKPMTDSAHLAAVFGDPASYVTLRLMSGQSYSAAEFRRGRLDSSRAALEQMDSLPASIAPPVLALQATLPLPGGNPSETVGLAERVRAWAMPELLREWHKHAFPAVPNTYKVYENVIRPHALGLLASAAGDYDSAESYANELDSLEARWYPSLPHDLAQGLRADVLLRQGRPQRAIEALDAAEWHLNYNEVFWTPSLGIGRANYVRAMALQQLGMHDEALRWFTYGVGELAPSHYHRGEIYEAMGDTARAIWHYEAFTELWKDADPELQVKRTEVLRHISELRGETIETQTAGR